MIGPMIGPMVGPVLLIAEREFRTYVATVSFWVALVVGPLIMAAAAGLLAMSMREPAPVPVRVLADDAVLTRSATAALEDVMQLSGRAVSVQAGPADGETPVVRISRDGEVGVVVRQEGPALLDGVHWRLFVRTVERDAALAALDPDAPRPGDIAPDEAPVRGAADGAAAAGRFALVLTLWMTLTGSLGMLLQAIVRERANRSLESLLAAVRPVQIVLGKVVGVGAVSLLVLGAWLGSAGALAALAPGLRSAGGLTSSFGDPVSLLRAVVIYVLAFAFYGLMTVAVGVRARDSATAQNLVRPLFGLLLAAFFVALATTAGAGGRLDWLLWVPPFTPFVLLINGPGAVPLSHEILSCVLLGLAAVLAGRVATGGLTLQTGDRRKNRAERRATDRAPIDA